MVEQSERWSDHLDRLWAPHRLAYVKNDLAEPPGCPFCRIGAAELAEGEADLVVARGQTMFAVLNLYPYNPGHLMVVPYRHVADLTELTVDEITELGQMTQQSVRTIKRVSAPNAFNVGLNLGGIAGGSVADHLHQHVVPRWSGDANFMTITGGTKVLPQLLDQTVELLSAAWAQD